MMGMEHMAGMETARDALTEAVSIHKAHMSGTEPTSDESQKRLMGLLEKALTGLSSGEGADEDGSHGDDNMAYMGFEAVKKSAAAGGARNPAAVAATAGRKKYGKAKFQKGAAMGKKKGHAAAVSFFKGLAGK